MRYYESTINNENAGKPTQNHTVEVHSFPLCVARPSPGLFLLPANRDVEPLLPCDLNLINERLQLVAKVFSFIFSYSLSLVSVSIGDRVVHSSTGFVLLTNWTHDHWDCSKFLDAPFFLNHHDFLWFLFVSQTIILCFAEFLIFLFYFFFFK